MAGRVPDTHTYSEQTVVNVVEPIVESLDGSFDDSVASYFDSSYEVAKDRLSNFRNYGPNDTEVTITSDTTYLSGGVTRYYSTSLYRAGTPFSSVRNGDIGQIETFVTQMNAWTNYSDMFPFGWQYRICRSYFRFNLTGIPTNAICTYAVVRFAVAAYHGWQYGPLADYGNTYIFGASCNTPIIGGDYDSINFSQNMSNGPQAYWTHPEYGIMKAFTMTSGGRNFIRTKFGEIMHVGVTTDEDFHDNPPNQKLGIELHRGWAWMDIHYYI
jgi:hypothetical protein